MDLGGSELGNYKNLRVKEELSISNAMLIC